MISQEYFLPYEIKDNAVFLDMETTGLSAEHDNIVVITYAMYFNEEKCRVVQLTSQDIENDEKALISKFIDDTLGIMEIYTFNGDEFEEKFFHKKMRKYDIDLKFDFSSLKTNFKHFGKYLKITSFSRESIENYFSISKERYYDMHKMVKTVKKEGMINKDLQEHGKEEILTLLRMHEEFEKLKAEKSFTIGKNIFYLDDFEIVSDMIHLRFKTDTKYGHSEFFLENGEKLTLSSDVVMLDVIAKNLEKGNDSMTIYETENEYIPIFINDDILFENIFFVLGMYIDNL